MKSRTPAAAVRKFREQYNLTGEEMDRLFGFSSDGRTTRRWESAGAPYYVTLMIAYVNAHGIELMQRLSETSDHYENTSGNEVEVFRERHNLDQPTMDRLFGFSSDGRATRRWKKEGAPPYAAILFAYANWYGLDLMAQLAVERAKSSG